MMLLVYVTALYKLHMLNSMKWWDEYELERKCLWLSFKVLFHLSWRD